MLLGQDLNPGMAIAGEGETKCFKKKVRKVNWEFEEQPKEIKLIEVNIVAKTKESDEPYTPG